MMCDTCGCNITPENEDTHAGRTAVHVLNNLLDENNRIAHHNREHFNHHGVLVINLMSSPGSGKTRLLEETIAALGQEVRIGVLEGDLATDNDAKRIRATGTPVAQITTGSACHLDAQMVHHALHHFELADLDLLFIENVGNLVCPANFDLGHHHNVVLLSVTEGDDKPAKYPVMFRAAHLVLLTKTDLLSLFDDFDPAQAQAALHQLALAVPMLHISAKQGGPGISPWLEWLQIQLQNHRAQHAQHA